MHLRCRVREGAPGLLCWRAAPEGAVLEDRAGEPSCTREQCLGVFPGMKHATAVEREHVGKKTIKNRRASKQSDAEPCAQ